MPQGRPPKDKSQEDGEAQIKALHQDVTRVIKLTVAELKTELKSIGLPQTGTKDVLITRFEDSQLFDQSNDKYYKDVKKSNGLGIVFPIPYGQEGDLTNDELSNAAVYWKRTESTNDWPRHLLSYEAWCGMTNYNEKEPQGGPAFQKLMLLILGNGGTSDDSVKIPLGAPLTYDAERRKYGPNLKTHLTTNPTAAAGYAFNKTPPKEWYHGKMGNNDYMGLFIPPSNEWKAAGVHLSVHSRPQIDATTGESKNLGLQLGVNNGGNPGTSSGDTSLYEPQISHKIYTKHDWLMKGMLQTGTRGGGAQSNTTGQSLVGPGLDKAKGKRGGIDGQCWEVTQISDTTQEPCMQTQNSLAAIYGLYYYPECTNPLLQWKVQEYVPETKQTFDIRFRCPNPRYGTFEWAKTSSGVALDANNDLLIHESLNPTNKEFLDVNMKHIIDEYNEREQNPDKKVKYRAPHTYVGGPHGPAEFGDGQTSTQRPSFKLPRASRRQPADQPTISPWMYLTNLKQEAQLVPFWNHTNSWHDSNKDKKRFEHGAMMREKDIFGAGQEVNGVAFGFRISQAFLLYPFRTPDDPQHINRFVQGAPSGDPVGYVTEPEAQSNMPKAVVNKPLAKYILKWDDWFSDANNNAETWRAKLLKVEAAPTPTQPTLSKATGKQPIAPRTNTRSTAGPSTNVQPAPPDGDAGTSQPTATVEPISTEPIDLTPDENIPDDTPVDDPVSTNEDNAQVISNARGRVKDTVATSFGIPGVGIAEVLKECDPIYNNLDITDADVRRLAGRESTVKVPGPGVDIKDYSVPQKIIHALKKCGYYDPVLAEGAPKRLRGRNGPQCHWRSSRHSPWSHEQCYEPGRIVYEYEIFDEDRRAKYRARYGHDANLIQDSGDNVKGITDVKLQWGVKKDILETDLMPGSNAGLTHCLNFARILVIFFAPQGVSNLSFQHKQSGMLNGITISKGSKTNPQEPNHLKCDMRLKNMTVLWPPVFKNNPNHILSTDLKKCLKMEYLCDRSITEHNELERCLRRHNQSHSVTWQEELARIGSTMKVREWITSPWHLEHLPYQKQNAIFIDGEGFSEGCKRCSRTFYEYAYHVYADRNSKLGTFGYPQDLWYHPKDDCMAPLPLHDPGFWVGFKGDGRPGLWADAEAQHPNGAKEGGVIKSKSTKKSNGQKPLPDKQQKEYEETIAGVERNPDLQGFREYGFYTGGTMDWPMFELQKRFISKRDLNRKAIKESGKAYFRRYLNVAYSIAKAGTDEDRDQTYYKGVPFGYMFGGNHKVQYGRFNYKVSRSHKYGNVCRDCATILDTAPGLFVRNNRWQFDGGLVKGNYEAAESSSYTYWTHMFGKINDDDADLSFDSFILKGGGKNGLLSKMSDPVRRQWVANFEKAARKLAETLDARHQFPVGWTRLVDRPEIHIQGTLDRPGKLQDDKPRDVGQAVKDLRALFNTQPGQPLPHINLANPALKDMLREAERKYIHNEAFARVDYTRQFDSDVLRTEYRNCMIEWSMNGLKWLNPPERAPYFLGRTGEKPLGRLTKDRYAEGPGDGNTRTYYNCLIVDQYDPTLLPNAIKNFQAATPKDSYRLEVYLTTRHGATGRSKSLLPTQWKGDGFVTRANGDSHWVAETETDGRALVQYRPMRQSRIFITYSLHRPITSVDEGRFILEKMADAIYTLFGTDRWLSEMIVFGKMLKNMDVQRQMGDNVSTAMWGVIDKTKKMDAMANFYGNGNSANPQTSYVYDTYETHVDKLDVDAGCEIGPKMGHPHFHLLLTVDHFGYVQFDYFKMNTFLEIMFRGLETFHGWGKSYMLPNGFYGDNENPYVKIVLYPQDNWKEILAAYVRKNAIPSIVEMESSRAMPGTAEQRRAAARNRAP